MIKFSNENILILIVDDTPKNLQVLGSLLSTEKYRIAFAKSGKDALEFAVKQLPNLILLDIMMPNMDGFEVCKRLKEDQKTMDIPIIFLTSLNDEYNEEKGLSLGAVDYITKPFRPIIVKARVENSLKLSCSYNEIKKHKLELEKSIEQLKTSEAKFRTIIETSPDAISITSLDGTVQFVSAQTVAMWGYTHENEIIGRNQTDFVRSDYHEKAARSIGGMFSGNFVGAEEYVMIRKDGSEFFCEANSNILYNEKGEPESILIIKRDITDRKNEELKKSEIRFRALHNASFGGIAIHDMGIIKECNQGLSHISGYTLDELIGMDSLLCIAEDSRKTVSQHIKASYEKPYEVVGLRKNGEEYTLRLESKVIPYEGKNMHVAEFRDITEQKQTEIELKIANHNLEQLNIHQNEIREKERKAISREIHDELGQSLSALNIDMGWIADRFKDEKDVNEKLEGMINLTINTITTVQRISYDLRPGLLDDLGLIPASEWYCQEFVKRTGISCDFNGIENNVSNENIDIALYRILQEGLTNILRHAKATKTSVKLTHTNSNIILKISDNGIGMDIKQLNSNQSLGFIGIKERIKALNGKFQVLTTKNKGTKLIATIPTI